MISKIIFFLFFTISAHAACTKIVDQAPPLPDTWRCADQGDEFTNGTDLFNLLNNVSFACGDTIILDAGVTYTGSTTLQGAFRLKQQTGCNGKYTRLVSSRLSELPAGKRVSPDDKPKMAIVRTRTSYPVFELYPNANNWSIEGLFLSNHQNNLDNNIVNSVLILWHSYTPVTQMPYIAKNIVFDRVLMTPIDRDTYGDADVSNTEGRAQLSTASTPFTGIFADNFQVKNSYIYGFTGHQKGAEVSWTSISQANPAVVTHTGIAAALGLSTSALSDGRCSGITGCNGNCYEAGGCARLVAVDGASNWLDLNGKVWARVVTADTVSLHKPDITKAWYINSNGTTAYDSTGQGTPTAAIKFYVASLLTQYGYQSPAGFNNKLLNNFIETWGNALFIGGSTPEPFEEAIIQSGSTSTSLILNHVRNLRVGDLISVQASGRSTYCTQSNWGCWGGGLRVGQVTAITGTTVTVIAVGADGIDVSPTVGGWAQWYGPNTTYLEARRNNLYLNPNHALQDAGKGPIEVKDCVNCLFDGNYTGPAGGNYFLTARNQGGDTPWSRGENIRFSHTVALSASLRLTNMSADNEHTNQLGRNVIFEHNVHPNAVYAGTAGTLGFMDGNALNESGWRHNTLTAEMGHAGVKAFTHFDCTTSPTNARESSPYTILRDNIVAYGAGFTNGNNCPSVSSAATSNLFVDTSNVGTSTITSALPGNSAVANYTGLFGGTCDPDNWQNCYLAGGSPYKGSASDGGDPGADIDQVKDRVNGWSEDAGLLEVDLTLPGMVLRKGSWQIGSTKMAVTFRLAASTAANCTFQIFTNRNRATAHADTSSPAACNRTGSTVNGNVVTFVAGTASALTASTTYFYKIVDGSRTMVGEFTTATAGSGLSYRWSRAMECGTDGSTFGTAVSANTTYSLSTGDVRYCRETLGADIKVLVAP